MRESRENPQTITMCTAEIEDSAVELVYLHCDTLFRIQAACSAETFD